MDYGDKLKQLRKENGNIKQEDLAEKCSQILLHNNSVVFLIYCDFKAG